MKTVIAPVDFSAVTHRVVEAAIPLARMLKARLCLVHVVPEPTPVRNVLPAIEDVGQRLHSSGRESEEKLLALKRAFSRKYPGIAVQHLTGTPVAAIVEQARGNHAAYIVMGSRGHSPVVEALLGSVVAGVVRKAPCPVLVVPPVAAAVSAPVA